MDHNEELSLTLWFGKAGLWEAIYSSRNAKATCLYTQIHVSPKLRFSTFEDFLFPRFT